MSSLTDFHCREPSGSGSSAESVTRCKRYESAKQTPQQGAGQRRRGTNRHALVSLPGWQSACILRSSTRGRAASIHAHRREMCAKPLRAAVDEHAACGAAVALGHGSHSDWFVAGLAANGWRRPLAMSPCEPPATGRTAVPTTLHSVFQLTLPALRLKGRGAFRAHRASLLVFAKTQAADRIRYHARASLQQACRHTTLSILVVLATMQVADLHFSRQMLTSTFPLLMILLCWLAGLSHLKHLCAPQFLLAFPFLHPHVPPLFVNTRQLAATAHPTTSVELFPPHQEQSYNHE